MRNKCNTLLPMRKNRRTVSMAEYQGKTVRISQEAYDRVSSVMKKVTGASIKVHMGEFVTEAIHEKLSRIEQTFSADQKKQKAS